MHLRAQAKLAFVFMLSEKNHMSIIFFFLKPALHVNHSLLVAITVKGFRLRLKGSKWRKWKWEGMKMRTACLYFSHTVTETAAEGLKDQTRRQETGASRSPQEWTHHSEKADFSIARTEGGTPAASQKEVVSVKAWASSSLTALYVSIWAYSSSGGQRAPRREFRRGTGGRMWGLERRATRWAEENNFENKARTRTGLRLTWNKRENVSPTGWFLGGVKLCRGLAIVKL